MQRSNTTRFLLLFVVIALLSSCSIFRKKNRCNTCPVWKDNVELKQELPQ